MKRTAEFSLERGIGCVVTVLPLLIAAGATVTGLAGCPAPIASIAPDFADIQTKVFDRSCSSISCHGAPAFKAGLDLESGAAYQNLVNVVPTTDSARQRGMLRVAPGDPANSFLVTKLTDPGPADGNQMPNIGIPLPKAEIDAIVTWIQNGAKP